MRVFLALPDRGLDAEVERALRGAMADAKHDVLADPPAVHAGLAASERGRFLASVDRMMEADLLLADVSEPDAGVGWCVAWFLARGRLVVLTCRRAARPSLASMLSGNPSPWQRLVVYDDARELRSSLATALA
ncbi:MAG TPA: hypothetical protein VM582_08905 [Candidatus Thermoplasmatota archaeon]|nr:hypothetical protein [Candidatus Thermoplasmatota archaeon]